MSVTSKGMDPALGRLVAEELAVLRTFVDILQQEQKSLVAGDIDSLTSLVTEKTSLASRLGQLAEQRNQTLVTAGLASDRGGMESWLAQESPAAKASRNDWQNLLKLAAEARALNQTNGTLITTRLQHNQQVLGVLLAASNQASLYGPDGQTKAGGSGRLFGAA